MHQRGLQRYQTIFLWFTVKEKGVRWRRVRKGRKGEGRGVVGSEGKAEERGDTGRRGEAKGWERERGRREREDGTEKESWEKGKLQPSKDVNEREKKMY